MLIIADARIPEAARNKLQNFGELLLFATQNMTYQSISGHPDIFICPVGDAVITAPATPEKYVERIKTTGQKVIAGLHPVGSAYPESARYNAFVNTQYLIHNPAITDPMIDQHTPGLTRLDIKQGYARCNLVEAGGLYVTSDRAIERALDMAGLDTCYIDPRQILLPGQQHGFFGGCTGITEDMLLLLGSLDAFAEGHQLQNELTKRNIRIIELYDGPLFDGGSILAIR